MRRSFRNIIDLSFWDSSGSSFWGLRRENARILALVFIVSGALLMSPPFDLIPNDWMNFLLGGWISNAFGVGFNLALLLTYVLVGPVLLLVGLYIYPYNTHALFNGYLNRAHRFVRKSLRNPVHIVIGIVLFFFMYHFYKGWLL